MTPLLLKPQFLVCWLPSPRVAGEPRQDSLRARTSAFRPPPLLPSIGALGASSVQVITIGQATQRVRAFGVGQSGQLRRIVVTVTRRDSVGRRQCGRPIRIVITEGDRSAPLGDLRQAIGIVKGIVNNTLSRDRQAGLTASNIVGVADRALRCGFRSEPIKRVVSSRSPNTRCYGPTLKITKDNYPSL